MYKVISLGWGGNFDFYMAADLSGHIGEWIAICNDKVVANGDDAKTVLNEAKSICGRKKSSSNKSAG